MVKELAAADHRRSGVAGYRDWAVRILAPDAVRPPRLLDVIRRTQ